MENLSEQILNRIAQLRIQNNITEAQLCRDIGKTPGYIASMTKNKSIPTFKTLYSICEYFGISLCQFFDEGIVYPLIINQIVDEFLKMNEEDLDTVYRVVKCMNRARTDSKGNSRHPAK